MSALGRHVHRWNEATAPNLPTLLLLHGTGGDENDLLPFGRTLLPGAAMLGVRGNVREGGAARFFRRLAEGVFDVEDLHMRTRELAEFLASAGEAYGFSASSLFALGYSNGANVAASLLLARPAALAGAALFRAMVPFEPDTIPPLAGKKVLISAGRFDGMIPPAGSERLAAMLQEGGADVELAWQATSHGLTQGDVEVGQRFFAALVAAPG